MIAPPHEAKDLKAVYEWSKSLNKGNNPFAGNPWFQIGPTPIISFVISLNLHIVNLKYYPYKLRIYHRGQKDHYFDDGILPTKQAEELHKTASIEKKPQRILPIQQFLKLCTITSSRAPSLLSPGAWTKHQQLHTDPMRNLCAKQKSKAYRLTISG